MSDLTIKERRSDPVVILDLKGDIRLGHGNIELHKTIKSLVERGEKNVLLNLAGVAYIDSSGLGELVASYSTLKKNNGVLKLLSLTDKVRDLMVITKLSTVFNVYQTESEAIESFQPFFNETRTDTETDAPVASKANA